MAVTKAEYLALVEKQHQHAKVDEVYKLGLVQSAALSSEQLMGDAKWDQYRQKLEALAQAAEADAKAQLDKMAVSISETEIRACQLFYHRAQVKAQTLRDAIALPMQLVEGYQAVKQ